MSHLGYEAMVPSSVELMARFGSQKHFFKIKDAFFASVGFSAEYDKVPVQFVALLSLSYTRLNSSCRHYRDIYMAVSVPYSTVKNSVRENKSDSRRCAVVVVSVKHHHT